MATPCVVIGVDIGSTNTDAVVVDKAIGNARVLSAAKTLNTTDITSGVKESIRLALRRLSEQFTTLAVQQVNIGTTHFVSALAEGKGLAKVAVIRLCGTASKRLPPFIDFPTSIANVIKGSVFLTSGGYQFNGEQITDLDESEILQVINTLKKNGERHIVVSGIFSPCIPDQENRVVDLINKHYPEASVTASNAIGQLGLLQRENAAILNECIKPLVIDALKRFRKSLVELSLDCPIFLTQNDGTLLNEELALKCPLHMIGSGITNAMRGAGFLAGLQDALVLDIGGVSMHTGILKKGVVRCISSNINFCGIKTNFRMPDAISIELGGGSYVKQEGQTTKIGPASAAGKIGEEAFVFAKDGETNSRSLTATDIAVAAGIAQVGIIENLTFLSKDFIHEAVDVFNQRVTDVIDQMRLPDRDLPLILVGGGSILVDMQQRLAGVSSIIRPDNYHVASAVGVALNLVSVSVDTTINLGTFVNNAELEERIKTEMSLLHDDKAEKVASVIEKCQKECLTKAGYIALNEMITDAESKVIMSGGMKDSIELWDKDVVPISYTPNHARIKIKIVAKLATESETAFKLSLTSLENKPVFTGLVQDKPSVTATGVFLEGRDTGLKEYQPPTIDEKTGEWLLSEYDIECISIGAGILSSGGGGDPHLGKLAALGALQAGKQPRVITPSKFFETAGSENDSTLIVALMGSPTVLYEKLSAGNESIAALNAMRELYDIGQYKNGKLGLNDGVEITEAEGMTYIDSYMPRRTDTNHGENILQVGALMPAEVGGMNTIEPLLVGADLGLPVLDCDGMGRAFPEIQMISLFIYDCDCFPSTVADDQGRRSVVLKVDDPKMLEDCFRQIVVSMGGLGGVVLSNFTRDQVMKYTVKHSLSFAWRIGSTVMEARKQDNDPVDQIVKLTNSELLMRGKVCNVSREISQGFTKGRVEVEGVDKFTCQKICIDIKNEFSAVRQITDDATERVVTCVPNLITVLETDSGQPIPSDELHYGMRVSVVVMPVSPLMTTEKALKRVGPQAFGYPDDVNYEPISQYPEHSPVGPM